MLTIFIVSAVVTLLLITPIVFEVLAYEEEQSEGIGN